MKLLNNKLGYFLCITTMFIGSSYLLLKSVDNTTITVMILLLLLGMYILALGDLFD